MNTLDELKNGDTIQMIHVVKSAFAPPKRTTLQGEAWWYAGAGWGLALADGAVMDIRNMVEDEGWEMHILTRAPLTKDQRALANSLDNPDLHVAFRDNCPIDSTLVIPPHEGFPFPVLVLNSAIREKWRALEAEGGKAPLPEWTEGLPGE